MSVKMVNYAAFAAEGGSDSDDDFAPDSTPPITKRNKPAAKERLARKSVSERKSTKKSHMEAPKDRSTPGDDKFQRDLEVAIALSSNVNTVQSENTSLTTQRGESSNTSPLPSEEARSKNQAKQMQSTGILDRLQGIDKTGTSCGPVAGSTEERASSSNDVGSNENILPESDKVASKSQITKDKDRQEKQPINVSSRTSNAGSGAIRKPIWKPPAHATSANCTTGGANDKRVKHSPGGVGVRVSDISLRGVNVNSPGLLRLGLSRRAHIAPLHGTVKPRQ
ncbi:PREDICTED: uncharacterized protein LOC106812508 isoform X2 [Priapulus caudatus]|uniref:Uncharacterized protein LOC106812508 isoform X2 n=1 Tax=Priapulus caudatus TaxID=37621 RepID=A0ABM1EI67_PRICU|nr:PREDICTED: uncharacterized protein LOC106812508 isoform X2 [Priapulus caudatus]